MRPLASTVIILVMTLVGCRRAPDSQPRSDRTGRSGKATATPPRVMTDAELAAEVDRLVEGEVRADRFAGVVLLSHRGQPIVRRAVGYADRERQRANTVDTPFALASVGKIFTAVVVAQLVDQKKIALDAPIGSLLPTYPPGRASDGAYSLDPSPRVS